MQELLQTPQVNRDAEWERKFLEKLMLANVFCGDGKPLTGPEGFPYLMVDTSIPGTEPMSKIIHWLSEKGIGLVVNAKTDPHPDMVLSYGMVWSLVKFGGIWSHSFMAPASFTAGPPTEDILPRYVRKTLKQFLMDQGVLQPRFLAAMTTQGLEFCFSLESLGNPHSKEHAGIAEAISWFLPPQFSVALASEKQLTGFTPI